MKKFSLMLISVLVLYNNIFSEVKPAEPTLLEKIQEAIARYTTTDSRKTEDYQTRSQEEKSGWAKLLEQLSQTTDQTKERGYAQPGYQRGYQQKTQEQPGLWQTIKDVWSQMTTSPEAQKDQYGTRQADQNIQRTKETAQTKWDEFKKYLEDAWKTSQEKAREYYEKQKQPQDTYYQDSARR